MLGVGEKKKFKNMQIFYRHKDGKNRSMGCFEFQIKIYITKGSIGLYWILSMGIYFQWAKTNVH